MYVVLDRYSSSWCYCSIYNSRMSHLKMSVTGSGITLLFQNLCTRVSVFVIFPIFAVTAVVNKVGTCTIWNTTLNKIFLLKDVIVSSHHRSLPRFADTRADNTSLEGGRFSLSVSAAVCWFVVWNWYHAAHRYIRALSEYGVHRQLVSYHFVCVCVTLSMK